MADDRSGEHGAQADRAEPGGKVRPFNSTPATVIDELMEKLPDFRRGCPEDSLSVEEYAEFGPVQLFRTSFLKSWHRVLDIINGHPSVWLF